jgi:bifunctional non-homologous end joining protein LigD
MVRKPTTEEPPPERAPGRPAAPDAAGRLGAYAAKRDFSRTSEPDAADAADAQDAAGAPRFVVQHHLATRLHHDLRLERDGVAVSWAVPKGLPDLPGVRHLAIQTEDHPLRYLTFEGDIPAGEYGGGPMRIWDSGTYEALEWGEGKATVRLHGRRHRGEYHLFRTDADQWLVVRADQPAAGELPPDPPALLPMLATAWPRPFDDDAWLFEVKWDGMRALARVQRPGRGTDGRTVLRARHGNDISPAWPELAGLWERVLARNAVLDGEIVALDDAGRPSFQRLQRRMHLDDERGVARAAKRAPVTYMVFDLLAVDGVELWREPLSDRLARLDEVLVPSGRVQRSAVFPGDGSVLFEAVREQGMEGVIGKRAASAYQPGRRSRDWRKVKVRREVSCVIGGWTTGEGRRSDSFGALLLGLYAEGELRYVGRAGTGFDEAELTSLAARLARLAAPEAPFADPPRVPGARWVRPELVCRIEYSEATEGGLLRVPVHKGLVDGADPRACTVEDLG